MIFFFHIIYENNYFLNFVGGQKMKERILKIIKLLGSIASIIRLVIVVIDKIA